jgi:ABC-type antimicrobial peptide transport system permease subunit
MVRALATSGLVEPHVTVTALLQALGVALVTGLAGSAYPAWRAGRLHVTTALG